LTKLGTAKTTKITRFILWFALVLVPLDKVSALGKTKINKIYFVVCARFSTFAEKFVVFLKKESA
jgi:hypothetical protein